MTKELCSLNSGRNFHACREIKCTVIANEDVLVGSVVVMGAEYNQKGNEK